MKKVSVLALFFALTVLAGVVFAAGGDSILSMQLVARAMGLGHVAGCTGSTSEDAVRSRYKLPLEAMVAPRHIGRRPRPALAA